MKLKLGLPKGSLQDQTFQMFERAGWHVRVDSRSYHPVIDDDEVEPLLIRPQEIPRYIEDGHLDAGITGRDWIEDCGSDLYEVADLMYSKASMMPIRIVLAAGQDSDIAGSKDLEGKRISTEYVRLTERWLASEGVKAAVEFSWGACEMKVPSLADAIVVNTETGSSLRAHNLKIVELLLVSTPRLVAGHDAWQDEWKRSKLQNMAMLLLGAIHAEGLVGLKMNARKADLPAITSVLPALQKPTLSNLVDEDWMAVETVLPQKLVRDLIPQLRRAGATGIVEYPLNKVVY